MRKCSKCKQSKKEEDFYKRGDGRKDSRCKKCKKELSGNWYQDNKEYAKTKPRTNDWKSKLKSKYGITAEDYQDLYAKQKGLCKICGKHFPERKLCVDHNHETGEVRGLLCVSCNIRLGVIESSKKKGYFEIMLDYIN